MRYLRPAWLILGLAVFLTLYVPAAGDSGMKSAHYRIPVGAINAGGGVMASQHFVVFGTAGQVAGRPAQSSHFTIRSGYWPAEMEVNTRQVYLPIVTR